VPHLLLLLVDREVCRHLFPLEWDVDQLLLDRQVVCHRLVLQLQGGTLLLEVYLLLGMGLLLVLCLRDLCLHSNTQPQEVHHRLMESSSSKNNSMDRLPRRLAHHNHNTVNHLRLVHLSNSMDSHLRLVRLSNSMDSHLRLVLLSNSMDSHPLEPPRNMECRLLLKELACRLLLLQVNTTDNSVNKK
jgi:hypothetical protein